MNYDNKNFILAIVLSMLIIFGWQYFYAAPLQEKLCRTADDRSRRQPQPVASFPDHRRDAPSPAMTALAATPRLKIETDYVSGSINLHGAQIDDLHLLKYRETINPEEPDHHLPLAPRNAGRALCRAGPFVPATGTIAKLPDSRTVWSAPQCASCPKAIPSPSPGTMARGSSSRARSRSATNMSSPSRRRSRTSHRRRWRSFPMPASSARTRRLVSGFWVFFEGMLGWLGRPAGNPLFGRRRADRTNQRIDSTGGWLGFTDKYWAAAIVPDQSKPVTASFIHTKSGNRDVYQTDYLAKDALVVQPGASESYRNQLFAGAKVVRTINAIEERHGIEGLNYMIDWGWFYFLTKPFFYLLDWLNGIVGNFGVAILLATVLVKLAVFPLANKSYASMSKMKKLQPEMEKLKLEFPDDRMKQQQAMMELYKREKVSPLSGCCRCWCRSRSSSRSTR
jgi:YidC/Oxa1 family membrane protein insertase